MKLDQILVEQVAIDLKQLAKEIVQQNTIDDVINLLKPKKYSEDTNELKKVQSSFFSSF